MKTKQIEVKVTKTVNILTFQDFVDFLDRRGALNKFVANMMTHSATSWNPLCPLQDHWRQLSKHRFKGNDLWMSAFPWCETEEGHKFWSDLDDGFRDFVIENNCEEVDPEAV